MNFCHKLAKLRDCPCSHKIYFVVKLDSKIPTELCESESSDNKKNGALSLIKGADFRYSDTDKSDTPSFLIMKVKLDEAK